MPRGCSGRLLIAWATTAPHGRGGDCAGGSLDDLIGSGGGGPKRGAPKKFMKNLALQQHGFQVMGWSGIHGSLRLRNQTKPQWIPRPGSIVS